VGHSQSVRFVPNYGAGTRGLLDGCLHLGCYWIAALDCRPLRRLRRLGCTACTLTRKPRSRPPGLSSAQFASDQIGLRGMTPDQRCLMASLGLECSTSVAFAGTYKGSKPAAWPAGLVETYRRREVVSAPRQLGAAAPHFFAPHRAVASHGAKRKPSPGLPREGFAGAPTRAVFWLEDAPARLVCLSRASHRNEKPLPRDTPWQGLIEERGLGGCESLLRVI
jgi:hypothetical protein